MRSCALESFSCATTKASSDSSALLKISPFPVFSQLCIKHSESLQHFWLFNLSFFPIFPLQKNLHFRLKNFSLIFTNFRNVLDTTNATNYKLLAHPKYFWQKQIKYFFSKYFRLAEYYVEVPLNTVWNAKTSKLFKAFLNCSLSTLHACWIRIWHLKKAVPAIFLKVTLKCLNFKSIL